MAARDLDAVGIGFDRFSSERALVAEGAIDRVLAVLDERRLIYTGVLEPPKGKLPDDWEPRPQLLFRATQFGDEVDRPLKKSDGSWTYFALDGLPYHGHILTILYDQTGERYHRGSGLILLVDGRRAAARRDLGELRYSLASK